MDRNNRCLDKFQQPRMQVSSTKQNGLILSKCGNCLVYPADTPYSNLVLKKLHNLLDVGNFLCGDNKIPFCRPSTEDDENVVSD